MVRRKAEALAQPATRRSTRLSAIKGSDGGILAALDVNSNGRQEQSPSVSQSSSASSSSSVSAETPPKPKLIHMRNRECKREDLSSLDSASSSDEETDDQTSSEEEGDDTSVDQSTNERLVLEDTDNDEDEDDEIINIPNRPKGGDNRNIFADLDDEELSEIDMPESEDEYDPTSCNSDDSDEDLDESQYEEDELARIVTEKLKLSAKEKTYISDQQTKTTHSPDSNKSLHSGSQINSAHDRQIEDLKTPTQDEINPSQWAARNKSDCKEATDETNTASPLSDHLPVGRKASNGAARTRRVAPVKDHTAGKVDSRRTANGGRLRDESGMKLLSCAAPSPQAQTSTERSYELSHSDQANSSHETCSERNSLLSSFQVDTSSSISSAEASRILHEESILNASIPALRKRDSKRSLSYQRSASECSIVTSTQALVEDGSIVESDVSMDRSRKERDAGSCKCAGLALETENGDEDILVAEIVSDDETVDDESVLVAEVCPDDDGLQLPHQEKGSICRRIKALDVLEQDKPQNVSAAVSCKSMSADESETVDKLCMPDHDSSSLEITLLDGSDHIDDDEPDTNIQDISYEKHEETLETQKTDAANDAGNRRSVVSHASSGPLSEFLASSKRLVSSHSTSRKIEMTLSPQRLSSVKGKMVDDSDDASCCIDQAGQNGAGDDLKVLSEIGQIFKKVDDDERASLNMKCISEKAEAPLTMVWLERKDFHNDCVSPLKSPNTFGLTISSKHECSLLSQDSKTTAPNKSRSLVNMKSEHSLSPSAVFQTKQLSTRSSATNENAANLLVKENQGLIQCVTDDKCGGVRRRREGKVKKWTLGGKIGCGAFGVVHLAMDMLSGGLMAVKIVDLQEKKVNSLRREINLLRSFEHENIVRYYGAENVDGQLHIFQEWVAGGSITGLLAKFGAFSLAVVRNYISQALKGLCYLHDHKIMHRDIKGANILVSDAGIVKLADFGASKEILCNSLLSHTMQGTPYFMAPEVFVEKYNFMADIWSMGCVAYQMFTGEPPWKHFNTSNPVALFVKVRSHDGPPPMDGPLPFDEKNADMDSFKILLKRTFQLDPMKRPNAQEMLQDPFFSYVEYHDDDNTEIQSLFSPISAVSSNYPARLSPHCLNGSVVGRRIHLRSNSECPPRSPFRSPLAQQATSPCRQRRSIGSISALASPVPNVTDWPAWAREQHLNQSGAVSKPIGFEGQSMGSLAYSEGSGSRIEQSAAKSDMSSLIGLAFVPVVRNGQDNF